MLASPMGLSFPLIRSFSL